MEIYKHGIYGGEQASYRLANAPFILGMIIKSMPIEGRVAHEAHWWSPEEDIPAKMVEKWENLLRTVAEEKGLIPTGLQCKDISARYARSVFGSRDMVVLCPPEELLYTAGCAEQFAQSIGQKISVMSSDFLVRLSDELLQFHDAARELLPRATSSPYTTLEGDIPLFAWRKRQDEWGENYCTTYQCSLAALNKLLSIGLVDYEMSFIKEDEVFQSRFYIPKSIQGTKHETEWLEDMNNLVQSGYYPQAMLVNVCERGTIDNFIRKYNRLNIALEGDFPTDEIKAQTFTTLDRYFEETAYLDSAEMTEISDELNNLL